MIPALVTVALAADFTIGIAIGTTIVRRRNRPAPRVDPVRSPTPIHDQLCDEIDDARVERIRAGVRAFVTDELATRRARGWSR